MNEKLPQKEAQSKFQKVKNQAVNALQSEKGKTWTRRVIGGIMALFAFMFFAAAIVYTTISIYIFKDGLEVLETLPDNFDNKASFIKTANRIGEMFTQMVVIGSAIFSWFMVVLGIGAVDDQLDYEREKATDKID